MTDDLMRIPFPTRLKIVHQVIQPLLLKKLIFSLPGILCLTMTLVQKVVRSYQDESQAE